MSKIILLSIVVLVILVGIADGGRGDRTSRTKKTMTMRPTKRPREDKPNAAYCETFISKNVPVCGTDNNTYENACALAEKITELTDLGMRCSTACPCRNDAMLDRCSADNTVTVKQSRSGKNKFVMRKRKATFSKRCSATQVQNYCLTDGTECDRSNIFCTLGSKPANVGIRCMGKCKFCKKLNNDCPAKLLQRIPYFADTEVGTKSTKSRPEPALIDQHKEENHHNSDDY